MSLQALRNQQSARIAGTHHLPFLTFPAEFQSRRSKDELDQSQTGQLVKVPAPKRTPAVMDLAEVIGTGAVNQIQQSGQVVFHSVGDTGIGQHWDISQVVELMALDFHRPNPADHPAFFYHLGDVTYNPIFGQVASKKGLYPPQFYGPYSHYPGKILAITGNHDSNPEEDPNSIEVFEDNFCAPVPTGQAVTSLVTSPVRQPMYQPGVYFRLDVPFANIIGLCTNGGELEGVIKGPQVGDDQWNFLVDQLKAIKQDRDNGIRKALLLAVHHPPFSGGGGHVGSTQMLTDLDDAFRLAKVGPDAVLSGHSHTYQRFTRDTKVNGRDMQVPYMVAGNGGHNIQPMKKAIDRRHVMTPVRGAGRNNGPSDHTLRQYFNGFGHLYVTITDRVLTIDLIGAKTQSHDPVDSVTVDLATNAITRQTEPLEHPVDGEQQ